MSIPDFRSLEPTDANLSVVLGHPQVTVNPSKRKLACPNCGEPGHTRDECTKPTMTELLDRFGADCYDTTQSAVENKRRIITEIYLAQP